MSSDALDETDSLTYDTAVDRSQIVAIALTLLILAAIGWRLHGPSSDGSPPPTAVVTAPTNTPHKGNASPTPTAATVAQRLAGVAIGSVRYAVVEQPDGSTALYRSGDDVPGLGKIVEVTENSATFEGADGRVRLNVKPPPSPTQVPPAATTAPGQDEATSAATPASPDRSATVSPPSTASGQPAS